MRLIDADALMDNIKRDTKKAIDRDDKIGSFWLGYAAGSVIAQPTIQPVATDTNVGDTISRQAVIDALHTWFRDGFDEDKWWNSTHVLAAIEGLPSVQQEHKWETCFECPLSHGCPKIKGCTNEQAIEYASQIPSDCPLSAQPEPKEGHWIWVVGDLECSKCHTRYPDLYPDYDNSVACPHCGARMKGEQNETD